ncbi:hypothetical protein [Pedobacter agri]|uniref:hypothetical protein n=1 Tax=Pedobacter agri TaxID=454586 RepID=UPI00292DB146|nr:hypothetical protein [Pedobacter agri]
MVELTLNFKYPSNPLCNCTYKLIQFELGVWTLFSLKGVQIGNFAKVNGAWEQIGGRQVLDEMVMQIGKLIDKTNGIK